jgi:chromosome segregation ATPase
VKQLQAQLAERDASNKSLTTTLTTLQATHADLLQQHSSTIALVHTLQTQLTASLTKVQTLETAHNTTTSALHRSERALADSQELCSGWEQKAQILLDRVERNRDIARKKIERLGKEVRERGKERDAAVMRASMLQGGLTAAEAERDALRMRVAAVEEECVSIGRSVSDVSRERDEGQREVVSLRAQLETRQTEQLTLVTRIAGLEANLAAETTTKLSLESQLLALKTSSEQMTKEITSKSAELHTALKRHREDSARIYQRHHRVLANLRQDLSSRTQLLEQRDADVATLNGSLATAHEEVRLLTLRLEVSAGLLESTKVMLDEAEARADALDEEAEELREAVASEREAVKRAREALVEMMRKRREEEEREMEKVVSWLGVLT